MKIATCLKLLFPAILLIQESAAASTLPCNVTSWSIIGDEFNLRHSSCQEIPADGALKIAVPAGFDLSNSDIIKQKPEGRWTLTKNGTKQIKFTSTDKIDANQVVEITLSNANAPAHYIVPFHKKFTEFSRVVTKQGVDCAKCTAAAVDDASTEKEEEIAEPTKSPTKAPTRPLAYWNVDWSGGNGNCTKQTGNLSFAPGLRVHVATCKDQLDGFNKLFCQMFVDATGTTLQSNLTYTGSGGSPLPGNTVTEGCAQAVEGVPTAGQCCFHEYEEG